MLDISDGSADPYGLSEREYVDNFDTYKLLHGTVVDYIPFRLNSIKDVLEYVMLTIIQPKSIY